MSASRIYHEAIKALAAAASGHGVLAAPDGRALADNPLCGDRVEMEITLADDRVTGIAHRVKGCLLCQAAASAIGGHAPGSGGEEIARVSAGLKAMLESAAPPPAWPELEAFLPVHGHRSRYRCVELPFEALLAALRDAESRRPPAAGRR
ncbi:MAG: iron-sulfur cluster assembly scaffold protein [Burkholderiales bacterium]|nr:iron-sulfur cluster assembly scaffold protein [Burkholderiales bacterium]